MPMDRLSYCRPKRSDVVFALIVFLAGASFRAGRASAQAELSDPLQNTVHGTVVNAVTHGPIGRALVFSSDNRYATMTDGEGHFEFNLPKAAADSGGFVLSTGGAGSLTWLMARKPGFLDDPQVRRQAEVSPGTEVTISLLPEALIKGRVTLPAADPVRGINVQLFSRQVEDGSPRWTLRNSANTNSNGEFRFAELQPGTYKVLTREWMDNDPEATVPGGQLYGFPPVFYPSATDFALASMIQLSAGQTFQADLSLVRRPYYPVRIPVTNAEQNGGMSITVSLQGQRGPGYSLGYNRGKEVIEGQLPNGKYLVEAATYGPISTSGSVNITVAGAQVEGPGMVITGNNAISVNVKEEFTSVNWKASGTTTTGGRTFATPKLRLDLDVWAESADDLAPQRRGSLRAPTGPNDDSMVLEGLPPGRYWLRPRASRGYIASATMGGTDLLREPLVVVPGANASIDITLRDDNAEIEGTLLGVPPTPVDSIRSTPPGYVYCLPLPDSPGQFLELAASSDGKFGDRMVAPGVYRVLAFGSPQQDIPYRDPQAMKPYETKGQVVHFAPGQKVSLQLEITSSAE
jgi:Carboxypeptidase regulatory-like domain